MQLEAMNSFWNVTLGGLIGSGLATAIVGTLLLSRNTRITEGLKSDFTDRLNRSSSLRSYQEKALAELFGPARMQLARIKRAFGRWNRRNDHLETNIIREGNVFLRDLFLAKGHLLPPELFEDAEKLVEHFDAWLEEYERVRVSKSEGDKTFVFAGPQGYPFPRDSERRIVEHMERLQRLLYGELTSAG
ncbi:hypothetical protein [Sphingomonas sp.]|uniref:hypothetical protein n=1 Tax=Sphingomonas sp. TaxID=28214 RepID=UPI00286E10B6|nr:hypothetical protein [Sphingomonas sp.]